MLGTRLFASHHVAMSEFDAASVADTVRDVAVYYPGFDRWYWATVMPGIVDGSRLVDTITEGGRIRGVAISKRGDGERKLCSLWVNERDRRSGVASALVDRACEWLGTRRPTATLPAELLGLYAPLIHRRGWTITGAMLSAYRTGKTEFVVNGTAGV